MDRTRLNDYIKRSPPDQKFNLFKILRGMFLGLIGGTAMIHLSSHFRSILRWTERDSFNEIHPEYEQLAMCIMGIMVIMIEPIAYLVLLSNSLNDQGIRGLLWLLPIAIPQAVSWALRQLQISRGYQRS